MRRKHVFFNVEQLCSLSLINSFKFLDSLSYYKLSIIFFDFLITILSILHLHAVGIVGTQKLSEKRFGGALTLSRCKSNVGLKLLFVPKVNHFCRKFGKEKDVRKLGKLGAWGFAY